MPYTFKKTKDGYDIYRKDTGTKVAHSDSLAGAKGYAWHAMQGESSSPKPKKPTKCPGNKIRSKGRGKGKGYGRGRGPRGIPKK